jgi:hypothetical protein
MQTLGKRLGDRREIAPKSQDIRFGVAVKPQRIRYAIEA